MTEDEDLKTPTTTRKLVYFLRWRNTSDKHMKDRREDGREGGREDTCWIMMARVALRSLSFLLCSLASPYFPRRGRREEAMKGEVHITSKGEQNRRKEG